MIINPNLTEQQVIKIIGCCLDLVLWRGLVQCGCPPDTAMDIILQSKNEVKKNDT